MDKKPIIYVVSDSVGETAELVTKAAMTQFKNTEITLKRFPFVEDISNIDEVLALAKHDGGMVAYTLVKPEINDYIKKSAEKEGVIVCDILGPLIGKIQDQCGETPLFEPGLVHQLDEDYYKKVEAIEFAVKYDDGRDPRGILKADIVLIGVSRTSKTPLSQYLAHRRFRVANVPIVPEIDPPEELFAVPKEKCFGLNISADKLTQIRKERLISLGLDEKAFYANTERIEEENRFFHSVVRKIDCRVIDVTNKAVEESANEIIAILSTQAYE